MPNITSVTFYFANPQQAADGSPILTSPPESVTLTWQQVLDNVGFSLSTGESMFTELPDTTNNHIIRVINGFYFGTGKYGSLLALQYHYDDNSDGWVSTVKYQSANAVNTSMMVGSWIKGLTYDQITKHANWKGKPYIGLENDYVDLLIERVQPSETTTCDLSLTPSTISIRLGDTATFDALHPYSETGTWTYDETALEAIEKGAKKLRVKPKYVGQYSITYKVRECQERAILYVLPVDNQASEDDPVEPAPPALPNTPPETGGSASLVMDLVDASKPIPPLHKYPNIMKRNSRYRGQRESEKVLNDHQEQIYDIRQLHKDISNLDSMKDATIDSWFLGLRESFSISMKLEENETMPPNVSDNQQERDVDSVRVLENDMVQLSGNSLEERIVGIYGIKRRMQELDERIAEAERRYRDYENAYE